MTREVSNQQPGKCSESGVTMIELLVSIFLLGLVVVATYSLYFFGMRTFQRSADFQSMQQEARFVGNFVTNKVRYAYEVGVLDEIDVPFKTGYDYFYSENGEVFWRTEGQTKIIGDSTGGLSTTLTFWTKAPSGDKNYGRIDCHIELSSPSGEYALNMSTVVLNLPEALCDCGPKPVVRYKAPINVP